MSSARHDILNFAVWFALWELVNLLLKKQSVTIKATFFIVLILVAAFLLVPYYRNVNSEEQNSH